MSLSRNQLTHLRALAHHCQPIVRIGQNGLTDAVVEELDRALDAHELVKIKLAGDRATRDTWIQTLCDRLGAETVQRIGHTATLFRRNPERPRLTLPDTRD